MEPSAAQLQSALLKVLAAPNSYRVDTLMADPLEPRVLKALGPNATVPPDAIFQALWSLVRQGLVFFSYSGGGRGETIEFIRLTDAGKAAADEEAASPDNPDEFFDRLTRKVHDASDVVLQYAREAITAYRNLCDLAATVMIGVASEAAFLELAEAFDNWLGSSTDATALKFRKDRAAPDTRIKTLFDSFRAAFEAH